jgi:ABC-type uncharacterized transport system permease subunit
VAAPPGRAGLPGFSLSPLLVGAPFMVITMVGLQEARKHGGAELLAAMTAGFAAGQIAGPAFVALLAHAGGRMEHASIVACALLLGSAIALFGENDERTHAAACPRDPVR